jgi:hypothetical protein
VSPAPIALAALLHVGAVQAQPVSQPPATLTVAGQVLDAVSMAPLPRARIAADGAATESDRDGRFSLTLPRGDVMLQVSAEGYLAETMALSPVAGEASIAVEVLLVNQSQFKEQVSVSGRAASVEIPPATTPITPLEVRSVAGAVENIYRVVQTLPGVSAADEIGSRLTVRGGGPDQNLTVMDGVEIHNPYRLFGLFSAFNPETVERFELTAGGFSPKYGDRLSSLLVVENRLGSESRRFGGSMTLGVTDTNVVMEGGLPGRASGSWLFTGRRTYYDLIAGRIIDQSLPSFGDLQATVSWEPRPGQRVTMFALRGREHTDATFEQGQDEDRISLESGARNDLVALSFFRAVGARGSLRTTVSWYRNTERLGVDGRFRNDSRRSNAPGNPPFANVVLARDLLLRDSAVREELALAASSRHLVETGVELHALDTGWAWSITGDRNPSAANGSSMRGGAGLPASLDSSRRAVRVGAWLTDRWELSPRWTVEPGVRFDWSGINGDASLSPRVALSVNLARGLRLRAAGGLFTQSPGYEKQLQSDYFVDLSDARVKDLSSERSWHGIGGLERELTSSASVRVEGYYKTFDNLIVGRLETPPEVDERLALYEFPSELAWSLPAEPQITSEPVNGATGRAYGLDVYLARKALSSSTRLSGWVAYTLGRADRDAYGRRYPFDYDRRHALSLVGLYRLSRLIDVAVTARVASGFPRTPVVGLRVAAEERTDKGITKLVPDIDANGLLVYTTDLGGVGNLNSARLPMFARVDVRMTFSPGWMNRGWQLYWEIINVANRRNAGLLEPNLAYDPTSDRPRVTYSRDAGVPLLPTFGVRYRF